MGHENIAVLNGGFDAWKSIAGPLDNGPPLTLHNAPEELGTFSASSHNSLFVDAHYVESQLHNSDTCILDARATERFAAAHMPDAHNQPYNELLDDGFLRKPEELQSILERHLNPHQEALCTCGSGVTACVIALAAHVCGHKNIRVYDGSWSEWGKATTRPIVRNQSDK